ncbi:MAG: HypC/HybG/HupF family hydrogenase formation chaperone [bacterium]
MSLMVPGKILEEYTVRRNRLGLVQFADTTRPIFLDLLPDAHVGDYVHVHVGFATERVSEADALRAYQQLNENGLAGSAEQHLLAAETQPDAARRTKPR